MIIVDNCLISNDIISEKFCCDLSKCKGICCVLGDAGAPLTEEEVNILDNIFHLIKPFMTSKGIKAINEIGTFDIDTDGEYVTPLVDNKECAYVVFDSKNIAQCAIEKAYIAGAINYRKPISCHLYPIRITKQHTYEAVNYHRWNVCKDAVLNGMKLKVALLDFLKEPLEMKYGKKWFEQLKDIQKNYK